MNVQALFPFGIRAGHDSVGADTLTVLTAGIHLDRRNARRIGWRGLRPCMGTGYAWTMRANGRDGVYGLAFLGEERDAACLRSRFSLFYFPDPEEAVLARYLPDARQRAAAPDYFAGIREFTRRESSNLFFLGFLGLNTRLDLTGLSFDLEAPARQRVVAVDGLPAEGAAPGVGFGVAKGGWACDVPALRLALPCFRLLGLSAASLLETKPHWAVARREFPVTAFTADGDWGIMEGEALAGTAFSAAFGSPLPDLSPPHESGSAFRPFSGRAFAVKEPEWDDSRPVLHVVSGFLGSGKTTFVSEWLAWLHNHDRHTAVLQNELGAKSLDSFLLQHETLSEALDEGCVCCTLADSLRPAIRRLMDLLPTEQIILETTGLANPGAVADALADLADMVRPGLCISLVDCLDMDRVLAEHPAGPAGLAGEQIRRADVLVCNKIDTVTGDSSARIMGVLKRMNPAAVVFAATHGRISFGALDGLHERRGGPGSQAAAALRPRPARRVTHQDEGYASLAFTVTRPVSVEELNAVIRLAQGRAPRVKGIVDSLEESGPMIVQYAAGAFLLEYPLSPPGPDRFLVFIGKGFDADFVSALARLSWLDQAVRP